MSSLSKAEEIHASIVRQFPLYKETAHWTPVIIPRSNHAELDEWLTDNGLIRGDKESRNDWLCPVSGLFLFKDVRVAVEVKLRWG